MRTLAVRTNCNQGGRPCGVFHPVYADSNPLIAQENAAFSKFDRLLESPTLERYPIAAMPPNLFSLQPLARLPGVVFAVLALLLVGHWLTVLLAPRPVAALAVTATAQAPSGTAGRLFGAAPGSAVLINGVRLTGIYVGPNGAGFASFMTPAGARGVQPGQEIQDGVVLTRLHPDHVVVLVGGLETRLPLRPASSP